MFQYEDKIYRKVWSLQIFVEKFWTILLTV